MTLICGFLLGLMIGLVVGVRGRRVIAEAVVGHLAPTVATATVANGQPACAVCGRPANPVRVHDGRYLCSAHKRMMAAHERTV
jgi:hypothetical protein